jgi:ABC-2 type transport system ATP-binding protein
MMQRVGLAQALVHDPEVYILDEPMSGLDPIGRALVKDIIKQLKHDGKTVFFSTHITDDVEKVCDRVGVIIKGELVASDKVETILKRGVEGYIVQLRVSDSPENMINGFEPLHFKSPYVEYYVSSREFNGFMSQVSALGIEVTLVETKRRDLEDFFLSLVAAS